MLQVFYFAGNKAFSLQYQQISLDFILAPADGVELGLFNLKLTG